MTTAPHPEGLCVLVDEDLRPRVGITKACRRLKRLMDAEHLPAELRERRHFRPRGERRRARARRTRARLRRSMGRQEQARAEKRTSSPSRGEAKPRRDRQLPAWAAEIVEPTVGGVANFSPPATTGRTTYS